MRSATFSPSQGEKGLREYAGKHCDKSFMALPYRAFEAQRSETDATGYNLSSLSGLKHRNFKTGASGFNAYLF